MFRKLLFFMVVIAVVAPVTVMGSPASVPAMQANISVVAQDASPPISQVTCVSTQSDRNGVSSNSTLFDAPNAGLFSTMSMNSSTPTSLDNTAVLYPNTGDRSPSFTFTMDALLIADCYSEGMFPTTGGRSSPEVLTSWTNYTGLPPSISQHAMMTVSDDENATPTKNGLSVANLTTTERLRAGVLLPSAYVLHTTRGAPGGSTIWGLTDISSNPTRAVIACVPGALTLSNSSQITMDQPTFTVAGGHDGSTEVGVYPTRAVIEVSPMFAMMTLMKSIGGSGDCLADVSTGGSSDGRLSDAYSEGASSNSFA